MFETKQSVLKERDRKEVLISIENHERGIEQLIIKEFYNFLQEKKNAVKTEKK
ncbi:hypothetical protein SCALIN_C17_0121 [Candidatus Scalindua japonica]|uniref:Uncharacterized protein n=1 Tax=Candidatus Scalindua japonica TaxID=1284222 RepID=A0A286TYX8_9BACT|nr:hypothetical protein [Candidatus Scalindua japonica]GAX61087.1 hypothetical protein SCALIN_C17_0121 [Candidatus Scalindua japonica]